MDSFQKSRAANICDNTEKNMSRIQILNEKYLD